MASFNTALDSWIPVEDASGETRLMGIRETLVQAHESAGIVDSIPPIQFGLYRLLVAFVMDAFELARGDLDDLVDQVERGCFDETTVDNYIERVGSERFNLFDPNHPFLQSSQASAELKPVANLFFHLPTGTNNIHFNHATEDTHAISPAVAARALCAVSPFMTAGGAGYSPSVNGAPPWYVLVRGKNLFETLLLNCYVVDDLELAREGRVPWRNPRRMTPRASLRPDSLLEGLTWRPREVQLVPSEGGICTATGAVAPGLVRQMHYGPGFKFDGGEQWRDPNVPYRYTKDGRSPLRPQEERAIWRDVGPLLLLRSRSFSTGDKRVEFSRPSVIDQFNALKNRFGRNESLQVEVYGMRTDNAKVFEWACERLALPTAVLEAARAGPRVQDALDRADSVAYALRKGLKAAYPDDSKGNKKAFDRLITACQQRYWSALKLRFWDAESGFLARLSSEDRGDLGAEERLRGDWLQQVRREAQDAQNGALESLGAGAAALEREEKARREFARFAFAALNPDKTRVAT